MNWTNFKPNLTNSTNLSGDWDYPWFFYDYDQFVGDTETKLIDYTKWKWSDVGIRGFRMDAVKHFTPELVGNMLDSLHSNGYNPGIAVGEWFDSNAGTLAGWVTDVLSYMEPATQAAIQPKVFDFSLRDNLRRACDETGSFDTRWIYGGSIVDATALTGFNVVTFVNNHDFRDNSGYSSLVHSDPILAYAYIMTNNQLGIPTIFYPDYFGYPGDTVKYPYFPTGLSPMKIDIDKLIQIHQKHIFGATVVDYLNRTGTGYSSSYFSGSADKCLIYQISGGAGGKEVIVAINFGSSTLQVDHQINLINGLATDWQLIRHCTILPEIQTTRLLLLTAAARFMWNCPPAHGRCGFMGILWLRWRHRIYW